ncbi:MAG: M48 family metallopeptidase [Myxococcales bacterium]
MSRLLIGMLLEVAPGAVAYWKGRRLVASLDAPALAERTQAALTRVQTAAFAVAILMPLALPHPSVALVVALSCVGGFVGWYPARRAIFRETWSLAGYLSHSLRFLLGYFGYWIAVASAPMFLDGRWAPAAVYGAILVVRNIGYGWLLAKLMYARPLDRAELEERFAAISARSAVAAPRVFACGPEQGTWPMAFALPAVRGRSTVLIARTLLERLEPDEIGAIYAHEVAHLEEHRGGKLARAIVFSFGMAFAAVAAPVLLRNGEVDLGWASGAVSLALFVVVFAWMASRKGDETKSDLRAAELCGDREAVASALAKLHQLGQVPRRMEGEAEALSTHPSLARRLQALRPGAPRALVEPVVLASSTPGSFVVLEADACAGWKGCPKARPPRRPRSRRLRASFGAMRSPSSASCASPLAAGESSPRACGNEVLRLDLRPEDARRAEEALNLLDGKLAHSEGAGTRALARLAACFAILAAFAAGSPLTVLLPGAAALFKPGPLAQTGWASSAPASACSA